MKTQNTEVAVDPAYNDFGYNEHLTVTNRLIL